MASCKLVWAGMGRIVRLTMNTGIENHTNSTLVGPVLTLKNGYGSVRLEFTLSYRHAIHPDEKYLIDNEIHDELQ